MNFDQDPSAIVQLIITLGMALAFFAVLAGYCH